ncbi:hypothetical protein J5N97_024113 [Dioscorea zingiberensis]|uniref:Uncharacterized protein n=1 Tax=Dioscorea zingiberensis TaxID=325984 RepID=A0A9D5C5U3_9LILI|nr:hypothetical protein J5N97_024113 [Dioscorea zingiberensis]
MALVIKFLTNPMVEFAASILGWMYQNMQLDAEEGGQGEKGNQPDKSASETEDDGLGPFGTWMQTGYSRGSGRGGRGGRGGGGRGGGRGGGGPANNSRRVEHPTDTLANTKQPKPFAGGRLSRGGGRGGLTVGRVDWPCDERYNPETPSMAGHLPLNPNPNRDLAIYEKQPAVGDSSLSLTSSSLHPPVGIPSSAMILLPTTAGSVAKSKGENSGASTAMQDVPRLITSLDRDRYNLPPSNVATSSSDGQLAAHDRLVDKVNLAITSSAQRAQAEDHQMEEEEPDGGAGKGCYDEDMPLAQVQKDAKLEALARRDKLKYPPCPKKGRLGASTDEA